VIIVTKFRFGSAKVHSFVSRIARPNQPRGVSVAEASQAFLKDRLEAPVTFSVLLAFDDFYPARRRDGDEI
jgi:hypothetical protein